MAVCVYFKSIPCAVISFASGVLIDADHLIDYYVNHGWTFKLRKIYETCNRIDLKKIYVVLHSYEFIVILWFLIWAAGLSDLWKAAAIGFTQHVIFDQFTNPVSALAYCLTYRIINKFEKDVLVKRR